jgi:TetR/AcrR family transcriptional repressor of nem operon
MGRPREFDETQVLEAAMRCFWAQGYEATSVRDLAGEMSITGASLYNAFGDKRALYRRALDHYVHQTVRARVGRLEATLPPLAAIRAFFSEIVERSIDDPHHCGCMLVNAALEVGAHDADLRRAVAEELAFIEAFFRRCVTAGQQEGMVASRQAPGALASLLLSVLLGIRVRARTDPGRDLLEATADAVLAVLAA